MERDDDSRLSRRALLAGLGAVSLPALGVVVDQVVDEEPSDETTGDGVAFVVQAEGRPGYRAVVPGTDLGTFSSAERGFAAVFDELDGGSVYTGTGKYRLRSQLSVPEGFRVSNTGDGLFVNGLDDEETACITFAADTGSDYLTVDCGNKGGVVLGEKNVGSDIDVWYVDAHRAGVDTASQHAIEIRGSGVKIVHADVYQGSKGIFLDGAYDVHVLSSVVTNSGVGLRIDGAEHCFFHQMDFDSCRNYAVRIDNASGIRLDGLVWNNTDFDAWPYRSVEIGANRPCDSIFTDVQQLSNPGEALYVGDVTASHLHHDITEADRTWYEYDSGITTTEQTAASCVVDGYVSPSVSDAVTGIDGGTFRLTGAGRASGTYVASGDGSTTTFRVPHDLGTDPEQTSVKPRSRDAAENFYVKGTDGSVITVEYTTAPASGSDNLAWKFDVSL